MAEGGTDWGLIAKLGIAGASALTSTLRDNPETNNPRVGFGDADMKKMFKGLRAELLKEYSKAQENRGKRIVRKGPSIIKQPSANTTLPSGKKVTLGGQTSDVGFELIDRNAADSDGALPDANALGEAFSDPYALERLMSQFVPGPGDAARRPGAGGGTGGAASAAFATGDAQRRMGMLDPQTHALRRFPNVADQKPGSDLRAGDQPSSENPNNIVRRVDARLGQRETNLSESIWSLIENIRTHGVY